jgi:hypothetical protein
MKTSDKIDIISAALLAAQREISNASKDSKNPHFKNSYASLGSVIDATKAPLNKAGIVVLQTLGDGGDRVCLTTRLLHTSGQWIEDTASTPIPKFDPQGVGSACTYLRRYSLAAALCITQEDDDGEAARPANPVVKAYVPKPVQKPVQKDDPF